MRENIKVYIASSFFNVGGYYMTENLASILEDMLGDSADIYVPHRNDSINDKSEQTEVTAEDIFKVDTDRLKETDVLIACLDHEDPGVCAELGYFSRLCEENKDKYIIGFNTDVRLDSNIVYNVIDMGKKNIEDYSQVKNAMSNWKYVNRYVEGLVKTYGSYLNSSHEDYDKAIANILITYRSGYDREEIQEVSRSM